MSGKITFVLGLIGGAALLSWFYKRNLDKSKRLETPVIKEVVAEATMVEEQKYTNAFLKDYKIVLPPVQASAAVKAKAAELQKSRRSIKSKNVKAPLYL
jgi:hypothetical protein